MTKNFVHCDPGNIALVAGEPDPVLYQEHTMTNHDNNLIYSFTIQKHKWNDDPVHETFYGKNVSFATETLKTIIGHMKLYVSLFFNIS